MKILLINPPTRFLAIFPLGLGYISRVIREEGFDVSTLDFNSCNYSEYELIKSVKNCDVVAIGGLITRFKFVRDLCTRIRRISKKKIIIGGGLSVTYKYLLDFCDVIVNGEGEKTIIDLLDNLDSPNKVDGIIFRDSDTIVKTKDRELIKDLNSIQFPDYEKFYIEKYINSSYVNEGVTGKKMNIIYGRGCPYQCTFCWHNFGRTTRLRTPENVIEEIKYLKNNYGVENVSFIDECLTTNKEALINLCESLKKLNIKWGCSSRVNLVDEKILRIMKDSGCRFIGFGIESGSQTMLNNMNKMTTVEQGKNTIKLCKRVGIFPQATFIVGTFGETKETILETVKFCKEVKLPHRIRLFWMTAFPDTPLYNYAIKNNMIKNEKKYIESLSDGIDRYRLNFSNMSMEDIKKEKEIAEKSCQTPSFSRYYNYLKYFGVKDTFLMFVNKIKEAKKIGVRTNQTNTNYTKE